MTHFTEQNWSTETAVGYIVYFLFYIFLYFKLYYRVDIQARLNPWAVFLFFLLRTFKQIKVSFGRNHWEYWLAVGYFLLSSVLSNTKYDDRLKIQVIQFHKIFYLHNCMGLGSFLFLIDNWAILLDIYPIRVLGKNSGSPKYLLYWPCSAYLVWDNKEWLISIMTFTRTPNLIYAILTNY